VVTIYPPAGSLESTRSLESARGGRGAVVGELNVLSQFFSQCLISSRILSQLVERKNGVGEVFSCYTALYYSAVRATQVDLSSMLIQMSKSLVSLYTTKLLNHPVYSERWADRQLVQSLYLMLPQQPSHASKEVSRPAASTVTLPDAAPAAQPCEQRGEQTGSQKQ
jgi:hypothetical protein